MSEAALKFSCAACQRTYTWKQELAGKRAKCKCGQVMTIPAEVQAPEPVEDDLYALSDMAETERSATRKTQTVMHPDPVAGPQGVPLQYQRAPTAAQVARSPARTVIDPRRDYYAPMAMLAVGVILYLSYYAIHYSLGPNGLLLTSIGLILMSVLETAVLIGFALVLAGPLGVSFGGIGTTILKLAAIAVFCDGVTTWVEGIAAIYLGALARGVFGFGIIGLPFAIVIYWIALTYLFSMDPGDSRMVVGILAAFYRIIRVVILLLLLKLILSFGGVSGSAIPLPVPGGVVANPLNDDIEDAKVANLLIEAREYINQHGLYAELGSINDWYHAGAKNVWFQVDRDINQRATAYRIVVELPDDPTARAKCYIILKQWCNGTKIPFDPATMSDTGERYMIVPIAY